jgi:prepilin-type N-terminal cleavage/methylation domain-containing protein
MGLRRRHSGFTIIELLVVITIVVILAGIAVPVISAMLDVGAKVECTNNLRQIGLFITQQTLRDGRFPSAQGDPLSGALSSVVTEARILDCPGRDPASPSYYSMSYAYYGNLAGATYTCTCSTCTVDGKEIWSLYWSGVRYSGGHARDDSSNRFGGLPLAENVRFQNTLVSNIDPVVADPDKNTASHWEARVPTIPTHQDTDKFHEFDVKKFRTQCALRMVPVTPEDSAANVPIASDVCVIHYDPWTSLVSKIQWWNFHKTGITDTQGMQDYLWSNHCSGSGSSKGTWGVNVLYADCSVRWKTWNEVRFQVLDPANHRFFFF